MGGEETGEQVRLFGTHSNYFFERNLDDRQRLAQQFSLLREDFNLWFDQALRLGRLSADPQRADWAVLDAGCGEGQYAHEVVRRYPHAHLTGFDADPAAVAAAAGPAGTGMRFMVHDARQPLPAEVVPEGGFQAAVAWMVLLYLPDKRAALAHLAAALAPGGVLMLGNVPDEPLLLDHPDARVILETGRAAIARLGMTGMEQTLEPLLQEAGFTDITTAVLRYPLGGATSYGHRWYACALSSFAAGRQLLSQAGLMDQAEYEQHLQALVDAPILDQAGELRFLVTLARRT
ncbi:MAG TPA: class I SAM-dependent methyltransferase [Streptosporangiaceae bacterium]|nr:class I SAM-dependent methyltransferase [Streptosporangiaceae bacterium]